MATLSSFGQEKGFSSQPQRRGDYSLVVYVSGGLGIYPSYAGKLSYLQPVISNINPVSTVRVMWHPDHLVRVGLETGYMTLLSYKLHDSTGRQGKVNLEASPVLVEWSMALTRRFNVFAGSGVYFLTTRLNYGEKSLSRKISVGWMAAASYIQPLSKNTGLGAEVKWLDAAESRDGSLCLQLQWVWRFLKW
ncbi:MAG: hypothetical protein ACXVMS_10000 [Flavisolibacter sp.]